MKIAPDRNKPLVLQRKEMRLWGNRFRKNFANYAGIFNFAYNKSHDCNMTRKQNLDNAACLSEQYLQCAIDVHV